MGGGEGRGGGMGGGERGRAPFRERALFAVEQGTMMSTMRIFRATYFSSGCSFLHTLLASCQDEGKRCADVVASLLETNLRPCSHLVPEHDYRLTPM